MRLRMRTVLPLLLAMLASPAAAGDLPPGILHVEERPAPGLQLQDMDGNAYDLADAAGRWRFVHFWASWCGPCRREMPGIGRVIGLLEDSNLEFVLVNTAETEDEVFQFLAVVAPELVPLMDSDGQVTAVWQPRGLPATFLVDPDGVIRYQALGGRQWDKPAYLDFLREMSSR